MPDIHHDLCFSFPAENILSENRGNLAVLYQGTAKEKVEHCLLKEILSTGSIKREMAVWGIKAKHQEDNMEPSVLNALQHNKHDKILLAEQNLQQSPL